MINACKMFCGDKATFSTYKLWNAKIQSGFSRNMLHKLFNIILFAYCRTISNHTRFTKTNIIIHRKWIIDWFQTSWTRVILVRFNVFKKTLVVTVNRIANSTKPKKVLWHSTCGIKNSSWNNSAVGNINSRTYCASLSYALADHGKRKFPIYHTERIFLRILNFFFSTSNLWIFRQWS